MAQKARLRSVERFSAPSSEKGSILIATDVAARGLDIKGIDLIIHYHVTRTADAYVHRSGRTARAESSVKSVLIRSPDEVQGVTRLERSGKSVLICTPEEVQGATPHVAKLHATHEHNSQVRKT